MPFMLWIGLALFAALAVIVVRADQLHNRHEHVRQDHYAETWATTGLPPGVTRSASGWYSCPRCGGAPCRQCAQRNWIGRGKYRRLR